MKKIKIFTVDSFSSVPFAGNPAGVCLDDTDGGLTDLVMQKIATEMNIAETAFVKLQQKDATFLKATMFHLRWFTPTNEVKLCGHATLATAAVLFNIIGNTNTELGFETKSGILKAKKIDDKISLDLPLNPSVTIDQKQVQELINQATEKIKIQDIQFSPGTKKLLLRLDDSYMRKDIEDLKPKIDQFMQVNNPIGVQGIILTLKGSKQNGCVNADGQPYDFVSRYFSPWNGIPEDPVTGAAHTVLTPYWAKELGKQQLYAYQCSARGGELWLSMRDDGRLDVAGYSTVVLAGTMSY